MMNKMVKSFSFMWCFNCKTHYTWDGRFVYCTRCHGDLVADYGTPRRKLYNLRLVRAFKSQLTKGDKC